MVLVFTDFKLSVFFQGAHIVLLFLKDFFSIIQLGTCSDILLILFSISVLYQINQTAQY